MYYCRGYSDSESGSSSKTDILIETDKTPAPSGCGGFFLHCQPFPVTPTTFARLHAKSPEGIYPR